MTTTKEPVDANPSSSAINASSVSAPPVSAPLVSAMTAELDAETAAKITELIEEDEGATNKIPGLVGKALVWAAVFTSLIHLYFAASGSTPFQWAPIVPTYILRGVSRLHLGFDPRELG